MSVQTTCPGCGVALTFATGAPIRVCDHCKAVVARKDRDAESLGRVVDLVDTGSPLELGLSGQFAGKRFTLVGHMQLGHDAGGTWDEWYAAFDDGRWGWLAEAQGRFYMTFHDATLTSLPPWDELGPGEPVPGLPGTATFMVGERAQATQRGAAGEIPFRFAPGQRFAFVDASAPGGAAATLDYGASPDAAPAVFVGRTVTLAELGWADRAPAERAAAEVGSVRVACPECDGDLELRVPDAALRVACQYCGALSSVKRGKLHLMRLASGPRVTPALPLGARATAFGDGGTYAVIGFMRRFTVVGGVAYDWDEYLLHDPQRGFRWLVCAKGHWTFMVPLEPGEVQDGPGSGVRHRGQVYRWYQGGGAEVRFVLGEFYWKVAPGQKTRTEDYVAPPLMLSRERDRRELHWSLGTYQPVKTVSQAFGVRLPAPDGVAPNQKWPYAPVIKAWVALLVVAMVLAGVVFGTRGTRDLAVAEITSDLVDPASAAPGAPPGLAPAVWVSEPFELRSRRNLAIALHALELRNSWLGVDGALINEDTGQATLFSQDLEYYSGHDSDGAWDEGSRFTTVYLSAPGPGHYVLRLEVQGPPPKLALPLVVGVREGVPRALHLSFLLAALSLVPLGLLIHRLRFEKRRWEDSGVSDDTFAPDDDDGDDPRKEDDA